MLGITKHGPHRTLLHHLTGVHHHDPVGHFGHNTQIVGDEEQSGMGLLLEQCQQVEDLGLHGDIEGGRRLIGDDEAGPQREGHGDHDPLALAARQLMLVAAQTVLRIGHPDHAEELQSGLPGLRLGLFGVDVEHLAELILHREHGIEAGGGILEDHRDLLATDLPHIPFGQIGDIAPVEDDLAVDDAAGALQQMENRQRRDALA